MSKPRYVAALLAVTATVLAVGATAPAAAAAHDKIRPELRKQLESKDRVDFWIGFEAKADLSKAASIKDWNARGTAVAKTLKENAAASQRAVRSTLDSTGVKYQSFWATNAIKVTGGKRALAEALATRTEVAALSPSFKVEPPKVIRHAASEEPPEYDVLANIRNIRAYDVWTQYGAHGEDITIASIDTGVQYDHPALVGSYRGNKGDGTFDHNYNWFDAAGTCKGAPCDSQEHGTHTMGTMVGNDAAHLSPIGVAPKAKWITANGCCPDDAALINSGQWMLEPTDLNKQNPDASKRPHIINNSWGTTEPTNEPFLEDISLAWAASGIFAVFANGNSGEKGCQTSGSPGSRAINYSVGAYDSASGPTENIITKFSSRGAGQDGVIKPDISAPGQMVFSSIPGSDYGPMSGTSMAAPHVAAAVALLWSAATPLVGDVTETRALLDGTAIDTPDDQCGGTDGNNNVYGEGRLDALAMVQSAPIGPVGRVGGTITDAAGAPLAGARLTIAGPITRRLTTGDDGTYLSGVLPVGSYTLTVTKYGYAPATATAQVNVDATTTADVSLTALPYKTVSGTVKDGSAHGWPLYAKILIEGYPEGPIFTDPVTGRYSVRLPESTTYKLQVFPQYDGYRSSNGTVDVGTGDLVHDIALAIDESSCTAPGYRWNGAGENFAGGPEGWTISGKPAWRFDNPGFRTPPNDGGGRFAIADPSVEGVKRFDTTLTSPAFDMSGQDRPELRFDTNYVATSGSQAEVSVSVDGGRTWSTVWQRSTTNAFGQVNVALPQAARRSDVRVRFHYAGRDGYWWAIDNVFLGTRACVAAQGGLVVGMAKNPGGEPVYATVARTADPAESGRGVSTPADPRIGDGLYWVFSSAVGATEFTASAPGYASTTATISIVKDAIVNHDWTLTASTQGVAP